MKKRYFIQSVSTMLMFSSAFAGGLTGPASFPSAQVLPSKVRNFQYNGVYTQGTSKYSDGGNIESLGASFDKTVTYQDLVDNEETIQDQAFAEAKISDAGYGLGDAMGKTNGQVNLAVNAHAPTFAYGVNDKITMAIVVPVIQSDLNVDVGSVSSESLQDAADFFSEPGQAMKSKLETVKTKFDSAVQRKLEDEGYDRLEDAQKTELGDIQLHTRYQVLKKDEYTVSLLNQITAPTGTKSDVDKLIDIGSGDEQWDIGFGAALDRQVNDKLILSGSVNYIFQLAHNTEARIYDEKDSRITDQVDRNVERDLGDIFQLAIGGHYRIQDNLTVRSAYSFQMKGEDEYNGDKFDSKHYEYTALETAQQMHAVQVGIAFDTIAMYKRKEFAAPLEVGVSYSKPIAGKNVVTDGLLTANMSLFF